MLIKNKGKTCKTRVGTGGGGNIMATYEKSDMLENALRAEIFQMADN